MPVSNIAVSCRWNEVFVFECFSRLRHPHGRVSRQLDYMVPSGAGADMDGVVGVKADTEDLRGIGRHMSATRCGHPARPATASVPGMSGWIPVNTRRDRQRWR